MKKETYLTGLTTTGKLTLGNYLGAIKDILNFQKKNQEIYLFVADLHSLTLPIKPNELRKNTNENLKLYLACGIDPSKVKLFKQSEIKEHSELFYLLSVNAYEGELKRMTQYKDKFKNATKAEIRDGIPVGLFIYPLLMAADILLYNPDYVPVGKDQEQHLELTRTLIERINNKYNLDFKLPKTLSVKEGSKIYGLRTPTKKMSKSDKDVNNTIFLLDEPEIVRKKIMSSLTDDENIVRYDKENKPGVSNLLTIYASIKDISIKVAEEKLKKYNYKDFKTIVADAIIELLKIIQSKYFNDKNDIIERTLNINRNRIQNEAKKNIEKIKKGIGLL